MDRGAGLVVGRESVAQHEQQRTQVLALAGVERGDERVASPNGAAGDGPGHTNVMASPTPENLHRLAVLLADGTLRIPVQATYDLAQAPEALAALAGSHTQGKVAIHIR